MCLVGCLVAGPALGQSIYVAAAVGTSTVSLSHIDRDDQSQIGSAGTAVGLDVRGGLLFGQRWGAELELSNDLAVTTDHAGRGRLGPSLVGGIGIIDPANPSTTGRSYQLTTHVERRSIAVSPLLWIGQPLTDRVELAVVGGASFDRMTTNERYRAQPSPGTSVTISPQATHAVEHRISALAGVETRIRLSETLRLTPGLRIHGIAGGWATRPSVAVGWWF